ncbi:hypothetical protein JTE90_002108 [Oedothorax gibbosus]|uniref:ZZ-type zinc finger-containing protein 3 n=1 Tax=Oedothorax gibbosus TaxID=931172 RepID=A0AAV6V8T8_9ARAC|nr:hypothetical protein JTE90_002108 [Oedothorax gibbosus]
MENIVVKIEPPDFFDGDTSGEMFATTSSDMFATSSDLFGTSADSLNTEIKFENESNEIKQETNEHSTEMESNYLGEFCFENDHPALKNNTDYKRLLQAIAILEAQRSKAVQDLDRLNELQEEALADPIAFVERLQRKEKIDVPGPQRIHSVPVIDWSKYSFSGSSAFGRRQLTRLSTKTTHELLKNSKTKANFKDQKPNKIGQYWTAEEQKRLEELLVQFPPEDVESRRWEKIANCLENRTPIQVASRVQKYFIKLMKAGIPIPGRMPSMAYLKKPRRNIIRQQPSTFLVSHTLPVYMPEGEDELNYSYYQPQSADENSMESRQEISDEEDIGSELKDTPEFKELVLLKKLQREKVQTAHEIGQHKSDHKIEEVHFLNSGTIDRDYTQFLGSDYNYLDPNYLPATT